MGHRSTRRGALAPRTAQGATHPMRAEETTPIATTSQVTTSYSRPPTMVEPSPAELPPTAETPGRERGVAALTKGEKVNEAAGTGIEGEEVVWEARYAM